MKSKRWICIQKSHLKNRPDWFAEWTLSYSRKESIQSLTKEGTSTWAKLKSESGWRCAKVEITLTEITNHA